MLTARATGGEPTRNEESSEVRWVPRKDLGGYSMDRSMRLRIDHYLEGRATPHYSNSRDTRVLSGSESNVTFMT